MLTVRECEHDPAIAMRPPGDRKLKVCIASMAPFIGGAEVAAERLALGLLDCGHDVFLVLGQEGAVLDRMRAAGLRCIVSPMYFTDKWHWLRYLRARNALRRILRDEQPDILHNNDLTTHQITSDAARPLSLPRICHHRFGYAPGFVTWLNKYGAEHHLFVSRALMDEITAHGPQWQRYSRAVAYDGLPLPPEPTPEGRQGARSRLGLDGRRTIVTFAGQMIERKGVADLLHAWALLEPGLRSGAELLLIGDDLDGKGKYRVAMEQLAGTLGCPVRFVGFQKNVGEWLLASDIAVVPSHAEPLGNATLEAMSYALPVIGCAVGGIPEMVVSEQTGLLVPPRSPEPLARALAQLLADPTRRRHFGQAGRQRCGERFSLEAHTQAVLAEYERVTCRVATGGTA
jgi:glycosyltransferase involved in cell wall biosynthesis